MKVIDRFLILKGNILIHCVLSISILGERTMMILAGERLHIGVEGTFAALRTGPCDVLVWVFNVARFTMYAI